MSYCSSYLAQSIGAICTTFSLLCVYHEITLMARILKRISLTTHDLINLSFVLQVHFTNWKRWIKLPKVLMAEVTVILLCFCKIFHFMRNKKIKPYPFSQTYSRNNGRLNFFLFREYEPMCTHKRQRMLKEPLLRIWTNVHVQKATHTEGNCMGDIKVQ